MLFVAGGAEINYTPFRMVFSTDCLTSTVCVRARACTYVPCVFGARNLTLLRISKQSPLPAGWEERTTATGRPYYVCHHTRTTQVGARAACVLGNVRPPRDACFTLHRGFFACLWAEHGSLSLCLCLTMARQKHVHHIIYRRSRPDHIFLGA